MASLNRNLNLQPNKAMPAIFVGHGNPMLAISDNRYSRKWKALGKTLPRPKAILSISAHWTTPGRVAVTGMDQPRTIHDFSGFPDTLYAQQYPAPGDPELAKEICTLIQSPAIECDAAWGLDHGTWTVLMHLFPKADIPVVQLSLDLNQDPQFHFDLGKALSSLREKGVLIFGSGNVTHNLSQLKPSAASVDWAVSFDEKIKGWIDSRDDQSLINAKKTDDLYRMAHPTDEHYLPLLYILAQRSKGDVLRYFNADFDLGTLSMRSFILSEG
ncbi:hypothetical protein MNBD_NITROSPIRAE01-2078 [hydrothermal vent metagenome]|uniref:Extradiol ring-cleavage dioxygenase class III enzyme subunit B domain-containing protein n=1 Tax=hydrothermal vent metagenome TaxID=652676 RepID=A0A3B1D1U7_9ZZZZ